MPDRPGNPKRPRELQVVSAPEPVWICGRCGRRAPDPATQSGRASDCKCGAPRSEFTQLATSAPGAPWHRPTLSPTLSPDGTTEAGPSSEDR